MAAVQGALFAIFLHFIVFRAKGQSNQNVTDTGSGSSCICDLIVNGCDPNCCCDVDCSASDKESFTECSETRNVIYDDRVCVSDQMIFIENVPFTTKNTGDGLFCIYRNNNENQEEYSDVSVITTNEDFTQSVKTRNLYSYQAELDAKIDQEVAINYKVGDEISLVFSNQARGYLVLPTMLDSSSCNDFNAAGYFQDATTECVRSFSDLSSECSSLPALSAASYYSNFQVAMSPQAFAPSGNTTSNSSAKPGSYNASLLFTPQLSTPLLCRDKTGLLNHCSFGSPPTPVYNTTTNTCENVVAEVSYKFTYSNKTSDLKQLTVSFVLGNIQENFVQKFSIAFSKEGQDNVFTKSGNPGYILDQPILAGLQTNLANKKAIILSTNKQEWLTIPKATLDGTCSWSKERLPVTFNINMRSGCVIRLNQSSACALIQDTVYTTLLGTSRSDHVASFGNSDVNNAADWVKIINDRPANTAKADGRGRCVNMVLGMSIEILFANVGYLAKPQPKIVGVRFKYEEPQTIVYQCVGQFCIHQGQSSTSQSVEAVSSVSFIDVSKPPVSDKKSLPEFQSKAPSDFFHPFL